MPLGRLDVFINDSYFLFNEIKRLNMLKEILKI